MPLPTKDCNLENAAESTSSPSLSPPTLQHHQDSIQNAYSVDQSQLAKGLSTSPQHQRIKSVISADSSYTGPPSETQQRPTSSPSALLGNIQAPSSAQGSSYFVSQPGTSGIEARSPANKRAPAYRSSHGIATSNGPPPALITQRSYHGDPWRNPIPTNQPNLPAPSHHQTQKKDSDGSLAHRNSSHSRTGGEAMLDPINSNVPERGATSNTIPYKQRHDTDEDNDTLRARHLTNGADRPSHNGRQEDDHSYSSHEDLFLHLARADSEAGINSDTTKKTGRRGSDFGISTSQPVGTSRQFRTRPASSGREFGRERSDEKASPWSRNQFDTPMNSRFSSPREQRYAASAHPLDQGNQRYLQSDLSSKPSFTTLRARESSNRETSPEFPASSGRKQSTAESRSATRSRTYKPSTRSHISVSGNYYNSSPIAQGTNLNRSIHPNDTESTTSTTAPSSVWDELDDLKSRIRKLELTGKLPSSSGAAIASVTNDRPRTATTTMTTASSSPKNNRPRNTSPEASTVKGTDTSSLHPLLHSALVKAKPLIDSKSYTALESTASDALTLAALTSATKSTGQRTSMQDPSRANDRQLRRKADSMCRSLTELCIALSEEKTSLVASTSNTQATSNESSQDNAIHASPQEDPLRLRASSQDPDRPSSRIISRLEARRTSLLASNASPSTVAQNNSQMDNPSNQPTDTSTPAQTNPPTSRSRMLHRRRTVDSNADTVTLSTHSSRSLSRNRQEQRPSLPTRISREYTSQHPLPNLTNTNNQQQRSPSILSSSLQKKSYFPYYGSSNTNSPATPLNNNNNIQPGNRRYLSSERERQRTPGSADESQRRAAERQQRIASLGQYSSGRRLRLVEGEQG
ncbi:MAG: hypothetical protein Q9209_002029 [Squamulea sp. 1 TL-2023]